MAIRSDPAIQTIVSSLAETCAAPLAGVCMLDQETCWVPVSIGIDVESIPASEALCPHVIAGGHPVGVSDLTQHATFRHNKLVVGHFAWRAFAAAPLPGLHGINLGTIFVADTTPRADERFLNTDAVAAAAATVAIEAAHPRRLRRSGATTIKQIEALIRDAAMDGDDDLVSAIDRVMTQILPFTGSR